MERVKYIRPSKRVYYTNSQLVEHDKDELYLRKLLRSLVKYQNVDNDLFGNHKASLNGILKSYAPLRESSKANEVRMRQSLMSSIMKTFVGSEMYYNTINPMYEKRNNYQASSLEYKKTHATVYSPIDYFSIPMLYHYYRFRERILKNHLDNFNNKKYPFNLAGLDKLIADSYTETMGQCSTDNMFFQQKDLKIEDNPTKGKLSLLDLQRDWLMQVEKRRDLNTLEKLSMKNIPISDVIKADVIDYMFSYITETKDYVDNATLKRVKDNFTTKYVAQIKGMGLQPRVEKELAEMYNFSKFDGGDLADIKPKCNTKQSMEVIEKVPTKVDKQASPFTPDPVGDQVSLFDEVKHSSREPN